MVLQAVALARLGQALGAGPASVGYVALLATFAVTGVGRWVSAARADRRARERREPSPGTGVGGEVGRPER